MTQTLAQRIVERVAGRSGPDRRGFLRGTTLGAAALATTPWSFLTRPASAYDAVCGSHNTCSSGYTVFCCTINGGANSCPPNSFVAGWWKADNASLCNGAARYYIDCNAFRNNGWACRCNNDGGTCDNRLVACNQFRYGQCNTQIPWENTGPVVCRVVSCTPPWQEYAGVCSSASRTDNNTTTHSAPCLNGTAPFGGLDQLSSEGTSVRLRGWAVDMDEPSQSVYVAVYQDGGGLGWFAADEPRPDVNSALGITGAHGFDITLTAPVGVHQYTVYAINRGPAGPNPVIATRSVEVGLGSAPTGRLERATSTGPTARLQGWSLDLDSPDEALPVAVYVDGQSKGWWPSEVARPDVNRAYGVSGVHGYDIEVPATNGWHTFEVWARNVGPARANVLIGRERVEVNPGALPRGNLESAVAAGGEVRLRGWAYDPDQPGTAIQVAVYDGARGISWFPTGRPRPDVNRAFGITGDHGFEITVPAGPGVRTYSVYGINVGGGATNPLVGQRTVTVGQTGGIGNLERVTAQPRAIRVTGWAFDREHPTEEIPVAVYVDGRGISWFPTGQPRPDVTDVYAARGDHGFDVTVSATPGRHLVTVYAIAEDDHPAIGSREVVVP